MALKEVFSKSQKNKKIMVYDGRDLLKEDPLLSLVFSGRSDGKTYFFIERALDTYLNTGMCSVYARRHDEIFKSPDMKDLCEPLVVNDKLAGTKWDGIEYRKGGWWLYYNKMEDDAEDELDCKKVWDSQAFLRAVGMSTSIAHKGGTFVNVRDVIIDEVITRGVYLINELDIFENFISTIARFDDSIRFYLLGNTVDTECPYFDYFDVIPGENIQQGDIVKMTTKMGDLELRTAVEWSKSDPNKKSNVYFLSSKTQSSKMITTGSFESADYPTCPVEKIFPKDRKFEFFLLWKTRLVKGSLVMIGKERFVYFEKWEEAIDEDKDIVFSDFLDPRRNWIQNIFNSRFKITQQTIRENRMFYDCNGTGEIVRRYLIYCSQYSIIKS